MFIKFTKLSAVLVMATIASLFSIEAKAEMTSLDEAFEDAYFKKGKNTYVQSSIFGQLNTIFGFTGFADQHITADGKAVDKVYQKGMEAQSESGMRMMTRDLANPYDTSIRENPDYSAIKYSF